MRALVMTSVMLQRVRNCLHVIIIIINSIRLSVCLENPEHCENGERYTYSYYGEPIGSCTRATQGTHLRPHMTTPSSQTGGWQPPVKTCIADCGQTVPDIRVVYIDSLWDLPTQLYHQVKSQK